uniref:Uncharacterized protein n=1 Tax=Arundo donax TaxID=35708 RepID=A0A0A8YAN2_ARUDO
MCITNSEPFLELYIMSRSSYCSNTFTKILHCLFGSDSIKTIS